MEWVIRPSLGVGKMEFGMTAAEVATLIGKPDHFEARGFWARYELRALPDPIFAYDQGGLAEIEFGSRFPALMFDGLNVFQDDPVAFLKQVWSKDQFLVRSRGGTTVSLRLGMAFVGFRSDDALLDRSVSLFRRGVWTEQECAGFDPVYYSNL